MTDALADRDAIVMQRNTLTGVIQATATPDFRYGRSEIKYFSTVDVAVLQKQVDALAKRHRELDTAIQALNWQIDVL